ncbi:hypothetical protein GZ78_12920 [Endozoicomonas numazuensis]|uniref:Uncharacterized protein n=1 Tax=Endozoicomonas numazuensis TaxID=1137799 RepID=A0A081NIX5_9GAMM|nr:hypothetical protein GZ78_12920 [Endozoicomonas numazuensis]
MQTQRNKAVTTLNHDQFHGGTVRFSRNDSVTDKEKNTSQKKTALSGKKKVSLSVPGRFNYVLKVTSCWMRHWT